MASAPSPRQAVNVDVIPIGTKEEWLALRETDVTASVVAALFGQHPYTSTYALWMLKSKTIVPDAEETEAMLRGTMLEPVAAEMVLRKNPDWRIEEPGVYLRDKKARLGATPDRYVYIPGRKGFGILQIKTVEESLYKKKWFNDDGQLEPPLWIAIQAETERHLSGADYAMVAVLRVGFGIGIDVIEIPAVKNLMPAIYENVAHFWDMVDRGQRPDPDYSRDGKLLESVNAGGNGAVLDMTSDNHLVEIADEDGRIKETVKSYEARRKEIKAEFLHKLGTASAMAIADGRIIVAKHIERAGYTVKPSSYVTVTVKEPKSK